MKQKQLLVSAAAFLFLCTVLICFACLLIELVGSGIWQERLNEVPGTRVDLDTMVEVMRKGRKKDKDQVFRSFCPVLFEFSQPLGILN